MPGAEAQALEADVAVHVAPTGNGRRRKTVGFDEDPAALPCVMLNLFQYPPSIDTFGAWGEMDPENKPVLSPSKDQVTV
jgi:hypothetical protein